MFKQPNFNKVLVLDTNRKPLMPCYPARARKLLSSGRASVFRRYPFTIIIHDRTVEESALQDVEIKIDQGSKTTGVALVVHGNAEPTVAFAAHIEHRTNIKSLLDSRRAIRVIAKDFGTIVKGSVKIEDGRARFNAGTPGRHYRIWLQPIRVRDI